MIGPIGVLDSGVGGLTIFRKLCEILPYEDLIYFGDTAHLPYGNKSGEKILHYSLGNLAFLQSQGIKALVVACHTASCFVLEPLRKQFPNLPILGVVESGVQELFSAPPKVNIAILGTRTTIESGQFQRKIHALRPEAQLYPIAAPLLVPLVEEGYIDHPLTKLAIQEYLQPLKGKEIDYLLLGCTHYSLLSASIQREIGPSTSLIDAACPCAQALKEFLVKEGLAQLHPRTPHHRFYVSDDPAKFQQLAQRFLDRPIQEVLLSQ